MYFLELYNKIFCFDTAIGITFVCENKIWKISKITFHEIEKMDLKEIRYLSAKEVEVKTSTKQLKLLQNNIKNFMRLCEYD